MPPATTRRVATAMIERVIHGAFAVFFAFGVCLSSYLGLTEPATGTAPFGIQFYRFIMALLTVTCFACVVGFAKAAVEGHNI